MAQQSAPFLHNPQEIRDNLYSFLPARALLPLAATCRQLQGEVQPLFYAHYVLTVEPFVTPDITWKDWDLIPFDDYIIALAWLSNMT